jgi:hypothetical protein
LKPGFTMKTCPACAVENPDTRLRCSACGGSLDPALAPTVTDAPPAERSSPAVLSDSDSSIHGRFLPGTKVAERYRIVSLAGRGGMGEVYRADDLKLGHPVALKFLPRQVVEGSRGFEYFLAEVRLSRQIAHPNVCRVYDISEVNGQHFLSMEYIDGEDLKGLIRRIGRLPHDKGIQIAQQLCAGLAAAHERGVLHRDLKPANIMLDGCGQVRITDFGLARLVEGEMGKGEISGTPAYMAPEQLARGETTIQSDLYSLGLILCELFTGQSVHQGGSLQDVMRSHHDSSSAQLSALMAGIDPMVERVIRRCLQKEPAQRPKSARAVAAALPGGDPLAAALAAGETPSPEMVAAAGEEGAIDKRLGWACLAGIVVGMAVICWLAQRTYLVNQVGLDRHPESLADSARRMIERLGYTNLPGSEAHGFRNATKDTVLFWYRWFPGHGLADRFWNAWGEVSLARINYANPPWEVPGELGVELDAKGRLVRFRAVASWASVQATNSAPLPWQEWFPKEFTGIDLQALETIPDRGVPPQDAYDQLQVWKAGSVAGGVFYVQAAAHGGRPVHFKVLAPSEFKAMSPAGAAGRDPSVAQKNANRQRGESLLLFLALLVLAGAVVLAWRNFLLGRTDRKGAFRLAFFLLCVVMLTWLLSASHIAGAYELAVLEIGWAQALGIAGLLWLYYSALEPYARRMWPQLLISWTRILDGRWRDPLVGQNLLLGVLAGVVNTIITQFEMLAPTWFGIARQTFLASHPLTLEGPLALGGFITYEVYYSCYGTLFSLMVLLILRFVLRRAWLVSCAYIVVMTVTFTLYSEAHPVLGWILMGLWMSIDLWIFLRLGFLAGIVMTLTYQVLIGVPLTTNFSAWYAGNGLIAIVLLLGLAGFGFYTSQGGRPIFQEELGERGARC